MWLGEENRQQQMQMRGFFAALRMTDDGDSDDGGAGNEKRTGNGKCRFLPGMNGKGSVDG